LPLGWRQPDHHHAGQERDRKGKKKRFLKVGQTSQRLTFSAWPPDPAKIFLQAPYLPAEMHDPGNGFRRASPQALIKPSGPDPIENLH
jgi:hypothetical protein